MRLNIWYFTTVLAFFSVFAITTAQAMSVIKVSAEPLYKEYAENYVRAGQKYQKYEYFLISGEVSKIESTWSSSKTDIRLNTGRYYHVIAEMSTSSYRDFLSSLDKKDFVFLLCPIRSSKYTSYGNLILGNCEPNTRYQNYLREESEKQARQEALRLAQLAKTQMVSPPGNITVTTAPSQLEGGSSLVSESKLEQIIMGETALGERAKYFVRYKGGLEDAMALESVGIILPHDSSMKDNYQIYSENDKVFLMSKELQEIERLLNSKQISTAISNIDAYRAKLFSQQLSNKNVLLLNNLGYYLEQNGLYIESAIILEEVVSQYPQRVAARINLGDAYWGINASYQHKALEHYRVYVALMEKNGRKNRIPQRIYDRLR